MTKRIIADDSACKRDLTKEVIKELLWIATNLCESIEVVQQEIATHGHIGREIMGSEQFRRLISLRERWETLFLQSDKEV